MQSITPPRPVERTIPSRRLVTDTVLGTLLIVAGVTFGVLIFATPLLSAVMPPGAWVPTRWPSAWRSGAVALVAPAGAILLGTSRLVRILGTVRRRLPGRSPLQVALGGYARRAYDREWPDPARRATGVRPVLGPFGAAVIRELPPLGGDPHPVDGPVGAPHLRGWVALENPLDRAVRDGERVRRWFGSDDADFVVKVYAAVTGPGHRPWSGRRPARS